MCKADEFTLSETYFVFETETSVLNTSGIYNLIYIHIYYIYIVYYIYYIRCSVRG